MAPNLEQLLSAGLQYVQKSLLMIFIMKVPMITITINFSSSKILCGLSMMYWVETVTDFQYRDQIRGIFSTSYVQVRSGKPMLCSFLPENCSKYSLVGSWWVSGADQQYTDHIFLKFEI